uniref:mRNA (guanine-N(7))-methyltransferase n=1 Tax=viral metagenome TaxID=1070528 RepID=A0A6C0I9Z7_9ZZZZ
MDLKDRLIELNISNLISCLEESNVKDRFIKENPGYQKIVKLRRNESTVIQMRDFHNWIKLMLININLNNGNKSLLDISTGRGGDLMKWKKAGLTDVFAFDISYESINSTDPENPGAKERLKNLKGYNVNVQFEVGDAAQPSNELFSKIKSFKKEYSLVSCQFALHYYFSTETALRNVLILVSNSLKKGGYFFGTTMDSVKVKEYLGTSKSIDRKLYSITREYPLKLKSPFGNKYTFTINDTYDKTNYFNTMGVSTEYLVDFNVLNKIAAEYNLFPVNLNIFEKYKKSFVPIESNIIPFESIFQIYRYTENYKKEITLDQLEISFLNSTFCFQKR